MAADVISSRMANALFREARVAGWVANAPVHAAVEQQRALHGGLWVGGKAELTSKEIRFAPNAMNRAVHANGGTLQWAVPLNAIVAVHLRKAFVTNIIDIETDGGVLSLRCWRAQAFADDVEQARRHLTR